MEESNSQNPDQTLEQLIMSETTTTASSEAIASQSQSSPQATRSYECTFCKRGFTNAQALGGHMNIHRKDKAKMKQQPFTIHHKTKPPPPPQQQQQSSEIANCDNPSYSSLNIPIMTLEGSDKFNVTQSDDQDHGVKWPNLFVDDQDKEENHDDHERACSELDLELRLGPEPPQDSSVATRTFF